jgi:hypothetical protein
MQLTKLLALAAIVLCLGASGAFATLVAPGGSIIGAGTDFTGLIGAELAGLPTIKYSGVALKDALGNTVGTGDLQVGVAASNTAGFIDFLYQYKVITGDLGDLSVSNFTGFSTDVGFATSLAGWDTPLVPASASGVQRGGSGSNVDFLYSTPVTPGMETYILVVKVNAPSAALIGNTAVQEGGNANRLSYGPVPEPSKTGVLVGLLFAAGLFVARRFQVLQS